MKSPSRHLVAVIFLGLFAGVLSSVRSAPAQESAPTDSDIFYSGAFQHPLIPIGGATTPLENRALSKAITLYAATKDQDDHSAILNFLHEFPHSPWRPALLNNLGLRYRQTGWFLKALAAWEEAWELSKNDKSRLGKPLADCIIGELARLNANLGRRAELESILKETRGRALIGPAMERITVAGEGLWMMRHKPKDTFRCGPLSLARLAAHDNPNAARNRKILSARSTEHGTSLSHVWRLSRDAGMNFQMAKRQPGATVIIPSLVNWKANHFAALVREDQGKFVVQDPTSNDVFAVSKAALDAESSGYYLVPNGPLPKGWSRVSAKEGEDVWGAGGTSLHHDTGTTEWDDKAKKCPPPTFGMATYNFHTQLVSLNIMDTPVGYTPPRGPDMHFTITYNQRERTEASPQYVSAFGPIPGAGQLWVCNWIAHVQRSNVPINWPIFVHLPGGGVEEGGSTPSPNMQSGAITTLEFNQTTQLEYYKRVLPDGSTQLFELEANHSRWLMTKRIDPQGNVVLFNYCPDNNCANYHPARPRLLSVTDALGQVTTIEYLSDDQQNIPDYFLIERITDPFGRFAWFEYNGNGQLWKVHDTIGIVSEFEYETDTDFIDALITPYKRTEFSRPLSTLNDGGEEGNARIIQAVDPLTGATERVEFGHLPDVPVPVAPEILATEPASALPDLGFPIRNGLYRARNSFYWDKKSTAMYPPQNGVYDYTKAKLIHWLHRDDETASNIKEREKMPLENAVYYFYPGQNPLDDEGTAFEGDTGFPSIVARVLADNTTQLWRYEYNNPFRKLTKSTDPRGRVTSYQYAANGIDLIAVFQGADKIFGCTYTDTQSHLPHIVTDAAGLPTTYTYTASKQVETVTNAKGEITAYEYGDGTSPDKPLGYLTKITSPSFNGSSATTSFTYDEDHRVQTVTAGLDDYTVTIECDALDRPTRKTYPDGTREEFDYTDPQRGMTLDLTASRDRLDRWTYRHYNADRQMDSITDPEDRTTEYDWCSCGSLDGITDPKEQTTTFHRDLQGRIHQKVFDDDMTINYLYEGQSGPNTVGATSRLKSSTDALNRRTNYSYFVDDNISSVTYTNTAGGPLSPPTPSVNYTYDPNYNRITRMDDGTGPTEFHYYPVADPLVLGAGRLWRVDGPLANDTTTYAYDQLGRVLVQSINGVAQTIAYDSLGRHTTTDNALGHFEREYDGVTPRLASIINPNWQTASYTYLGNDEDRRLETVENMTDQGGTPLSRFDYTYDDEGQIMSWNRVLGGKTTGRWFEYDDARQLTSAHNASDPSQATQVNGYGYDPAGNRTSDSNFIPEGPPGSGTFHSYTPNNLNQIESFTVQNGMVSWEVTLIHDLAGNLVDDGEGKTFEWDAANRLTAINYAGGQRTEFAYDGLGRRVKITEYGPGVTAVIQPSGTGFDAFSAAPFSFPAGNYSLLFEGLNNSGGNMAFIDGVTLNNVPVADGGFETPDVSESPGGYEYNPTNIAWSFIGDTGIAYQSSELLINQGVPDGKQAAFIQNDGSVFQVRNVTAGTYTLRFHAAQWENNTADQQVRVNLRPSGAAVSIKRFVWCGYQICEERDGSGGTVTKRFFAEGEQRLGGSDAGNYYYSRDHLGSIREVTAANGGVVARYDYDSYGKSVVLGGNMTVDFGYTGHYFHAPSGLNLTLYRAYNPALGRWLNRDPIGEAGGTNLYGYVENSPVNYTDPLGLWSILAPWTWFDGNGYEGSGASFYRWSDFEQGAYAGLDGLNPFGDPFADNGFYDSCDETMQLSQSLGRLSQTALWTAGGAGLATRFSSTLAANRWIGKGSYLFGRGGQHGYKGIFNQGSVRTGWGWVGPRSGGRDVFRTSWSTSGNRSYWNHLDWF